MVTQYPHVLQVNVSVDNETDGNYVQVEPNWVNVGACRAEYKGGGEVEATDGKTAKYSFIIYTPDSLTLIYGQHVRVLNELAGLKCEGTIKQIFTGAFNTRIWL